MKTLIVRIVVPNAVTDSSLNELGEELQYTLPVDCRQSGMNLRAVTYEIQSKDQSKDQSKEQVITVALAAGQKPYELVERHGSREYQALRHFFEDIGFTVKSISLIIFALCAVGSFGQ